MKIRNIKVKGVADSRGNPTVEVGIETNKGKFSASVPSGASKGKYEALELRDADGKGVKKALAHVKKIIAPAITNKEFENQEEIDKVLIALDGTENKSNLGVNAILPVSLAVCRALASSQGLPLYKYIARLANNSSPLGFPKPCFNVINGGAHAKNNLNIQEFMIIPQKGSFRENFKLASDIYTCLHDELLKNFGEEAVKIGDEGGFMPKDINSERALYILNNAIKNYPGTKIGLDSAASQFYSNSRYNLDGKELTRQGLLDFYKDIIFKFPIIFIEDPFGEEDWEGFAQINRELGNKINIFGDDLLATNIKRIAEAENRKACAGLILKPNQIGTVTETLDAVKLGREFGWKILVAHRSGETCDDFIADLAVGIGAEFIKAGAPLTPERMAKYNRLLEIENELHPRI
ncbi:MAG: enolase [Candidatus Staskawiczbacteria bacterium]|jgi:enolase